MEDKVLTCQNCSNVFVWSKEEQKLYAERGLSEPTYCPICRGMFEAERAFREKRKKHA